MIAWFSFYRFENAKCILPLNLSLENSQALFSRNHPYYKLFSTRSWSPYSCVKNSLIISSLLTLATLIIDALDTYHKNLTLLELPGVFGLLFMMCLMYVLMALPFKIAFLGCKDLCKVYRTTYPSIAAKEDYSRLNFMLAQWQWVVRECFKDTHKLALVLAASALIATCLSPATVTPYAPFLSFNLTEVICMLLVPFNLTMCILMIFPPVQCLTLVVLRRDLQKTPKLWWSCLIAAASWLALFYCLPWIWNNITAASPVTCSSELLSLLVGYGFSTVIVCSTIYLIQYCLKAPKLSQRV